MQNSPCPYTFTQAQHPNELVSPTLTLIALAPSQGWFFFFLTPNEKRVQVHQYSFVLI